MSAVIAGATSLRPTSKRPACCVESVDRSIGAIAAAIASSQDQLRHAIAEAAYYRAEQRGFAPGHELEDWLAAQQQINGVNDA